MPAAIPFIIQAVGYLVGANAIVVAVVAIAAAALVSNYQKRKQQRAARDAYNASLEDRLIMTSTSDGPRKIVYGRTRNVDAVVFKGTFGPKSEYYTIVAAMAGHEIDGYEKIYLNDIPCTLLADGAPMTGGAVGGQGYWIDTAPYRKVTNTSASATAVVTGGTGVVVLPHTPIAGSVSAGYQTGDTSVSGSVSVVGNTVTVTAAVDGTYDVSYQWEDVASYARIWMYTGAAGQTLYPYLSPRFGSMVQASDKFSGMAIIVMQLTYSQDVFPNGPPSVTAVMRGKKILDTRTGVTAWSENPAMIARDWALHPNGGNMRPQDLHEDSFKAAANACDVSTVFNTTAGNETRPLYQCGIVCDTSLNPDDHFGEIVESMAGKFGFSGGLMKVVAGVYRAPVAAIDDTWLSNTGAVTVVKDIAKADRVNYYKPTIANADGFIDGATGPATSIAYTATPMPAVRSATYIAADGQELIRDNVMLGVTRNVHAQHICGVLMRDARDSLMVTMRCNMKAWQLELFDTVTLTLSLFGFNAKQFEVLGWKYDVQNGVELTLKETGASIYSVSSGLDVLDAEQNTALPLPWVVEQVTGVTVTSSAAYLQDGWPVSRVQVSWNPIVAEAVRQSGTIEIQYTIATDTLPDGDWASVTERGDATSTVIPGLLSGTIYLFRVRAVNTLGVRGKWSVQKSHLVASPPLIGSPILDQLTTSYYASDSSTRSNLGSVSALVCTFTITEVSRVVMTGSYEKMAAQSGMTLDAGFASAVGFYDTGTTVNRGNSLRMSNAAAGTWSSHTQICDEVLNPGTYDAVIALTRSASPPVGATYSVRETEITVEVYKR